MSVIDIENCRKIIKHMVVEANLVFKTPVAFASGDTDEMSDMPLLVDALESKPLLTGTTLAGALRSYLRSIENGDRSSTAGELEKKLFGGEKEDDQGSQSLLIVEDSIGEQGEISYRDGVRINRKSKTAEDQGLYNREVWEVGTTFPIRLELLIPEGEQEDLLKKAFETVVYGLQSGEITLGARKTRGYGQIQLKDLRKKEWDLTQKTELLEWIKTGSKPLAIGNSTSCKATLPLLDNRQILKLKATFDIEGSILIRSAGKQVNDPDFVSLQRKDGVPVIPGTSLAGVMRHRADKIMRILGKNLPNQEGESPLILKLFGYSLEKRELEAYPNLKDQPAQASRLTIGEAIVTDIHYKDMVQARVSIDRFTGGSLESALFNEQPVWGGQVTFCFRLQKPEDAEVGLLLLLLKDLWTGDLPIGGESSIGRGRLKGKQAILSYKKQSWTLQQDQPNMGLIPAQQEELQKYVNALIRQEDK